MLIFRPSIAYINHPAFSSLHICEGAKKGPYPDIFHLEKMKIILISSPRETEESSRRARKYCRQSGESKRVTEEAAVTADGKTKRCPGKR
jgi:hypothetical protein